MDGRSDKAGIRMRCVPKHIGKRDNVTLVYDGSLTQPEAEAFTASIEAWRKGEGVLYIPKGSHIELTKRQAHPIRAIIAKVKSLIAKVAK